MGHLGIEGTPGPNLETRRGRLPSGSKVLACKHIRTGDQVNPKLLAWKMKEVADRLGMPRDFESRDADYFMICAHCAIKGDAMEGLPYQMLTLHSDVVIG